MYLRNFTFKLVIIALILVSSCHSGKKTDYSKYVQKVDNIKDFKKLLRTRINILVLFGTSDSAINSQMSIFGEAAVESKGIATLLRVDCSTKEGKKLCKKQKVKPDPTLIQHYKDGEYSADYERKFTVKSISAFLKNPGADGPWEEEDDAQDVVHIHNENELNKILKKKKRTLIMFYAPWCGFCKKFKPHFSLAATELKGKVILAGVDADSPDASSLREVYNITGFPKTIYFENGKQKFDYSGGHSKKEDIIDWLKNPQPEQEKEPEKGWDEEDSNVNHLTDENFDEFIAANEKVMVMFYAPWCGHCKNLKPHWDEAAAVLEEAKSSEKLAAVDATKSSDIATRYNVKGYPTVIYFENGEEKFDASTAFTRTADGIVKYIKDPTEPPPPEKEWHETESDVQHLTDADFKEKTKKKKHSLIMFYAPWCGHCKKAKPEYTSAAAKFADDKKVMFAAVDCTKNKKSCDQFSVRGYPTLYYVSYGKSQVKYEGGREEKNFIGFLREMERGGTEKYLEENFWKDVKNSDLLHHLTEKSWESFIAHNPKVLIAMYDPMCPNCQALRQHISDLARELKNENIKVEVGVVHVDMKSDGIPHLWSSDIGVPTLYWYVRGGFQAEYTGVRSTESMMRFIKQELQESERVPWCYQESSEDVTHLDDTNFDEFVKENEETLVFFYSPNCKSCIAIQTVYAEAATLVEEEKPGSTLAAVNIRKAPKLKMTYEVHSTPMIFYFKKGKKKFEYNGETTSAEAFLEFMEKPRLIKKKPKMEDNSWFGTSSKVNHVDQDSLLQFVAGNSEVLVMFYAPWCGHCKKFKPEFSRAANILAEKSATAKLGAFDGSNSRVFNSKYDVKGYPTVVYFRNGKYVSHYKGQRSAEAVVQFLTKSETENEVTKTDDDVKDEISSERPSEVELLDPNNFQQYLNENPHALIMFYAPWCGTCKKIKDAYFDAAVDIAEDLDECGMAIFNAFKYRSFAEKYGMKGYPTIWYFNEGNKKFRYNGKLNKESFVGFMENPQETKNVKETNDAKGTLWIGEKDGVEHLSRENFDKTLAQHETAMVYFYINACNHCLETIKPLYVKAAWILSQDRPGILLAAVNGNWEKPITTKYNVNSYPTFLYFKNGKMMYEYKGPKQTDSIVKFLKNPTKELAQRTKPTSWQDLPDAGFGRVEHLSNKSLDSFLQKYETSVILLHSLWRPSSCVKAREALQLASMQLPEYIGAGAIDCHRLPEQGVVCYNLSVTEFPTFKYFKKGVYQKDIEVLNADDLVNFLTAASQKTHDEL